MRKTTTVVIEKEGDDFGKTFQLEAMSAYRLEKWSFRAITALSRSRADIPPEAASGGLRVLLAIGVHMLSGLQFSEVEPLMDEMLGCVKIVTMPGKSKFSRELNEDDINEIATLVTLRIALIELHTGFTTPAALLKSISERAAGATTSAIPTSPLPSAA